ncbi:MAG: beta-galactosidase [Patescibacteria group bacterium]|nr:hypothetical protein [Patescibacteria group bacterium]
MKKIILISSLFFLLLPILSEAKINAFGMNMHLRERITNENWDEATEFAASAGVKWAREQFNWDVVEPTDNTYSWTQYDNIMTNYQNQNINVLGLLTYSSSWASTNPGSSNYYYYPPNSIAWKDYVSNVATHYADSIDYWEIWNEPNHEGFWLPEPDYQQYAVYLYDAYTKIKAANPDAKVIIGGMSGTDTVYLGNLIDYLKANYETVPFDIVAVHPYRVKDDNFNYSPEQTVTGLNSLTTDLYNLRALMKDKGFPNKPVWLTEFGWSTYTDGVYDKTQASFLMREFILALAVPKVEKGFWYDFRDDSSNEDYIESNFGIMNNDWTQKTAYPAYSRTANYLVNSTFKSVQLISSKTVDDFSKPNTWEFSGTTNTNGSITGEGGNKIKINYKFTKSDANCYAPVAKEITLPLKSRVLQFRAKGSNSTTELRMRIKDKNGETFQYNIGNLPSDWLTYRINLAQYTSNWGGDANGKLDRPLKFQSFVIDDNPDGSKDSGNIWLRGLKSSSKGGVYYYKFKKKGKPTYAIWNTNGSARVNLSLSKATQLRMITTEKESVIKASDGKFNIKLTPRPKILRVKKQK